MNQKQLYSDRAQAQPGVNVIDNEEEPRERQALQSKIGPPEHTDLAAELALSSDYRFLDRPAFDITSKFFQEQPGK